MKCYAVITAGETAFFRARADALLFIRARNDSNSRLEVQETTEQQLSAFALYECTDCINLPVAFPGHTGFLPEFAVPVYTPGIFLHRTQRCGYI